MATQPLTPREIADRLSWREYSEICRFFDLRAACKRTATPFRKGETTIVLMPLVVNEKFDILYIERKNGELLVTACGEDESPVCLRYTNLVDIKRERVAS